MRLIYGQILYLSSLNFGRSMDARKVLFFVLVVQLVVQLVIHQMLF